jgi:hypothetical protein
MPKVYVHIGLPKTATTTLQADFFPSLKGGVYDYIGTPQPRDVAKDPLYMQLYQVIRTGVDISGAKKALVERLSEGKSIIFSEEAIVVREQDVPWQKKLENLAVILDGVEFKLLVTVREPVAAMFSFYVELYQRYKNENRSWQELATEHNDFKIYHYEFLYFELERLFGHRSISTAHFEKIVKGDLSEVMEFLDTLGAEDEMKEINRHNSKKSDSTHVYVERKVSLNWLEAIYRKLGGPNNQLLRYVKNIINPWLIRLRRKSAGYIKINKPSAYESLFVKECLLNQGQEIQLRHGVDYLQ